MQRRYGLILAFFLGCVTLSSGQSLPYTTQQRAQIERTRQGLQQFYDDNYQRAVTKATQLGRPLVDVLPGGRVIRLQGISETGELLYITTFSNVRSAQTTRTTSLYAGGGLGLNLSGSSASVQNKLGIWDGSRVRNTHVELVGRVTQIDNPAAISSTNDDQLHATHVSGTLIATGVNPQVRGMAYRANLKAWDSSNDAAEMSTASPDLLLSNHSYGGIAGWRYNDSRSGTTKWEWYGDTTISTTEDYKFGFYDSRTQNFDRLLNNAPLYLSVWAAANQHDEGPVAGTTYYLVNNGNRTSTQPRSDQSGYDLLPGWGSTAKNTLVVAAANSLKNTYTQPSDVQLTYFSSWGPTDDGRIKPDITGAGQSVLSSINTTDSSYAVESGTSMASPNVAGSLLLLQEYYAQLHKDTLMRASTLKGLALHTTDEAGTAPGPDYRFGWGLLNTERAARVLGNADKTNLVNERSLTQGATYTLPVVASGKGPLRVTICWTDPEGPASTASKATLNSRTPKLINDLDIRLSDGTQVNLPWTLNPDQPKLAAAPGDNIRDNVEQILISNPVAGKTYSLTVSHKGTLTNTRQDYALIISGIGGKGYCASAASSSADSKIGRVQIGPVTRAGADGCTTYTDNTTTVIGVQAGQTVPLSVTTGTCGTARSGIIKAFVDWNQDGDFDDANEVVATSGVTADGATFTASIAVPMDITDGQFTRMRLVLSATGDPATVTACGSYATGETQDFTLQYSRPANDVGVVAILSPTTDFCGPTTTGGTIVAARVRNYGATAQTNIPVTVRVLNGSNVEVGTVSGTIPALAAYSEADFSLRIPATIQLAAGQTYQFLATTTLATDQITTNNQVAVTRTTAGSTAANGVFTALQCGANSVASLNNTGSGTAYWYDSPTAGTLLAAGNRTTAPARPTYYVALNDFAGQFGPAGKQAFGGGSYGGGYIVQPLLSVQVPLVIESARLYIGTPGRIRFSIRKLDETVVSSVDLNVYTTRTLPVSATTAGGQLADDPNDPGAEYPLNLRIPAAGDYKLTLEYNLDTTAIVLNPAGDTLRYGNSDGVTIFRSNTAVTGFPFSLPGIISTKGSLFKNATTGTTDTLSTAWYYLYNIQIRSLGCPAVQRTAVTSTTGTAATAMISADGSTSVCQGSAVTLRAGTGAGYTYQWLANGRAISGATSATYVATSSGNYTVQVANACQAVSSSVVVVSISVPVAPAITQNGQVLTSNATVSNQWLFNGVPIPGATGQSFTVTQTGRYSVRASVGGCGESVSDEVYVSILATEPVVADNFFTIYPSPASKLITVEAAAGNGPVPTLQLIDGRGALLHTTTMQLSGKLVTAIVDISALPGGTFFVRLSGDPTQAVRVKRFSKQ